MSTRLIHLATILLLIAQGWFGVTPGTFVCLPLGACDTAESSCVSVSCGGNGGNGAGGERAQEWPGAGEHDGCHQHGPVDPVGHGHEHADECCVHLHVPAPAHHQAPVSTDHEAMPLRLALIAAPVMRVEWRPAREVAVSVRALIFDCAEQEQDVSLRATRLLV